VAALKAPLIIGFTLLLCIPSLYVFSAVAGAAWTRRSFIALLAGFAATLALVLLALLPINWLFASSSRHLGAAAFIEFALWVVALRLAWRFLGEGLRTSGAHGGMVVWLLLFCIVSLQAATVLRPVLSRKPGGAIFVSGKKSFLEQIGEVFDEEPAKEAPAAKPKR
jgi:energy-coupling factor transporter transmembrane protein EcfT